MKINCKMPCTYLTEAAHKEALFTDLTLSVEAKLLRHGTGQRDRPLI